MSAAEPEDEGEAGAEAEAGTEAGAGAEAVAGADTAAPTDAQPPAGSGGADEPSDGVPERRTNPDRRRGKRERRAKPAEVDANRRSGPTERRQSPRRRSDKRKGAMEAPTIDPFLEPSASGTIPVRDSGVIDERPARRRTEPPPPPRSSTAEPVAAEPVAAEPVREPVPEPDPGAVAEAKAAAQRLAAAEAERIAAAVADAERVASEEAKRIATAVAQAESARLVAAVADAERAAAVSAATTAATASTTTADTSAATTDPPAPGQPSPQPETPGQPSPQPEMPGPAKPEPEIPATPTTPAPEIPATPTTPAPEIPATPTTPAPEIPATPTTPAPEIPATPTTPAPEIPAPPQPETPSPPAPDVPKPEIPTPVQPPAPGTPAPEIPPATPQPEARGPRPEAREAEPARTRPPITTPPVLHLGRSSDTIAPPLTGVPTPATAAPPPAALDDGEDLDGIDPIALATLALQRLRARARTDLATFRVQYQRLDGLVLVLASLIVFGAGFLHRRLVQPPRVDFDEAGLRFKRTTAWLTPEQVPLIPSRLIRDQNPPKRDADGPYHVAFTSTLDGNARLEVFIDHLPAWSNYVTGLELDRRTRFGELYAADPGEIRSIAGHDWLRTSYRFAHAADKGDEPSIGRAVEYAAVDREQIYIVTFFGTPAEIEKMESVVAPTLQVESRTGLPFLPQVGRLSRRTFPAAVGSAFQSTVMVVVADLVDGRLRARGGGSGIIVGRDQSGDGSILTNYHVLHDHDGRLHDVFVIGRFVGPDRPPTLVCAGRPSRSKLQREADLALIKCDTDLDGRAWSPAYWHKKWPTIPSRLEPVHQGERLWVLGYPDVGGGGPTLSQGLVEGLTGEDGSIGTDYIKTDASITHGNSGGPVVDDSGKLIGIATAFRVKVTAAGGVVESAKVGLVRPLASASELLAIATAGWTPREGRTSVELEPTVDAPAEGIRISTHIIDASNKAPVSGALLLVLRPGITSGDIDMNRLDDLTLAWGRSDGQGEVYLKQPVPAPGTYSVMVVAKGFEPLIGDNALKLGDKTPAFFDPWGEIAIKSR